MPTPAQIRADYEAEIKASGEKFSQRELNHRIASTSTSGQLEKPKLEEKITQFATKGGGTFGDEPSEAISGPLSAARNLTEEIASGTPMSKEKAGLTSTFRTPEQQAGNVPPVVFGQADEPAPLPQMEGAFEPLPGEQPAGGIQPGGPKIPKMRISGIDELDKALKAVPVAIEGAQAGIEEGVRRKIGAIGKIKEAEIAKIDAEADVMEKRIAVARDFEAKRLEEEERRQNAVNAEMDKLRDAVDQMKASKIDPYRFYRHPDGGVDYPKSIGAAIAIGLGALGSTLPRQYGGTGGPNMALQIIERAIDRDIQAQRDDLTNQRAGVGMQMNLLGQMRGKFSDERQAENAARIIMLENFNMKMEETAKKSGSKQVAAKAAMAIAEAREKQAVLAGDMEIKAATAHAAGEQTILAARNQRAKMIFDSEAARIKAMSAKTGKMLPTGAIEKLSGYAGAQKILSHVKRAWNDDMKGNWAAGVSQYAPWATDAKSFDDMILMAAQMIGKKFEGRMTDEDFDRFKTMMPNAGDSTTRAMKKMQNMGAFLRNLEESDLETHGRAGYDVSGFLGSRTQGQATEGFKEK